MIETVRRASSSGPLATIAAVLNGTCNFVLDSCADRASLEDALAEAKRRGFAEDNPTDDLSGRDAERKLRILAKHAFGTAPRHIETYPLDESIAREARNAAAGGSRLRQISRAWTEGGRVIASVKFERIDKDSTFGRLTQECNGLEILRSDGQQFLATGRGAGRWPTAEAVMADVFDSLRHRWTCGRSDIVAPACSGGG
jgi:homoserine dehydrogenase